MVWHALQHTVAQTPTNNTGCWPRHETRALCCTASAHSWSSSCRQRHRKPRRLCCCACMHASSVYLCNVQQHSAHTPLSCDAVPSPSGVSGDSWHPSEFVQRCQAMVQTVLTDLGRDAIYFDRPVDKRLVPDYYTIIKTPMDLGTINQKLRRRQYRNPQEFHDVRGWWFVCLEGVGACCYCHCYQYMKHTHKHMHGIHTCLHVHAHRMSCRCGSTATFTTKRAIMYKN